MSDQPSFEARISALDLTLFDAIESQSSPWDRTSWLAVERLIRARSEGYIYLEIGSHLGGSLQPHLLDPRCRHIYSIDKRPPSQPDDRHPGAVFHYPNNSSERMLDLLRQVAPGQLAKVQCLDCDASELSPKDVSRAPHLCLIDGEHTQRAVLSDWTFCLSVARPDAVICFHDMSIVQPAIDQITAQLRAHGRPFEAGPLAGDVYAISLGQPTIQSDLALRQAVFEALDDQLRRTRRLQSDQLRFYRESARILWTDERNGPSFVRVLRTILLPILSRMRKRVHR